MRRIFILVSLAFATLVYAHEGHRPLPTRGMEVDAETGKMVLTKTSRDLLDVQTAEVTSKPFEHTIWTYGSIVVPWNQHAVIASPLAGRIVDLKVSPGETVQAGQVVAVMESLELEQLVLELRAAQIDLLLSEKLVANLGQASQSGAVPGARLRESQSKLEQDRVAIELGRAKWQALRLPIVTLNTILRSPETEHRQLLELRTPIGGVVTHADLSMGKNVDPKEHLFEILDLSRVWLKIQVLEKDLTKVAVGQQVSFQRTSSKAVPVVGTIDVVGASLDSESYQGTVWATLENGTSNGVSLLPGVTGKVQINIGGNSGQLVIPFSSVMRDGAERFALVEQEQTAVASIYQKQALVLGRRSGDQIEVLGGNLFPGDRVVTRGVHELGGYFAKGVLKVNAESARDIGLQSEIVSHGAVAETITIAGVVDVPPTHRSIASAQLGGAIEQILVDRGETVRKGQVLAEIASESFKNLQLDLLKTNLDVILTTDIVQNFRSATEAIAARQLWEMESQLNQLTSRRDKLIQQLLTVGVTQQQISDLLSNRELMLTMSVRAPIDGVVVGFDKFLGHVVSPEEPLFEIHDLSHAWVQGFVSELDFPRIGIGQNVRVRFDAATDEIVVGTVTRSGQAISKDDRTLSIWIDLKTMPSFQLQHKMMARISIETGAKNEGLRIPRQAIVHEGLRPYVFVEGENRTFERRYVVTGPSDDLGTLISSGLRPGEAIAIRGARELQSGYAALK